MWGNLVNQRKIPFFNVIKSEEMPEIYKEFMKINEIFIPKKFMKKGHDTGEEKKINEKLNLMKLKTQASIGGQKHTLKDKMSGYWPRINSRNEGALLHSNSNQHYEKRIAKERKKSQEKY